MISIIRQQEYSLILKQMHPNSYNQFLKNSNL
nr:MAG TPA: hypothetical protein [Bacteriophage sp.]